MSSLREPVLTFLAAIAAASALFWLGKVVPFIHQNLHAFIAVIFFYAPVVAGRIVGRSFDFRAAGLRLDPLPTNLAVFLLMALATFPLFGLAFFKFYDLACGPLGSTVHLLGDLCPMGTWTGWRGGHVRWPDHFATLALNQVLVIALPEELFFRGYLLGRLQDRWPPTRRFLGAPVGLALVASSVMFALGHFLVDFNPQRLAVFFPGLVFAWMRARTGSLAAGTAYHASCNLLSDVLHASSF